MKRTRLASMLVAAACAVAVTGPALAADQQREQAQTQSETRERIYGSELMTPQERNAYRTRMRALNTQQEREQFRKEHHEQMKERAKQRGMTLPDEPPAQGRGMGPRLGDAPGAGRGPGPGSGGGPAKGR